MSIEAPQRGPDLDELEALIEEARRRTRRRRRRYAVLVASAVLAGAGLYVLVAQSAGGPARSARATPAAGLGPQVFRPGQFWYTRTVSSQHQSLPAGGVIEWRPGYFRPRGPEVRFDLKVIQETWVGVDGTMRERMIVAAARFASAAGRAKWAAYGRPVPNFNHVWLGWMSHDSIAVGGDRFPPRPWYPFGGEWLGTSDWDVGDGLFTYRQLTSLPTEPAALRARLQRAEKELSRREPRTTGIAVSGSRSDAFGELSDIAGLLTSPVPAAERRTLLRAALTLPGATVNRHARDSLGRPGVAVSTAAGPAFQRLIFDPSSGALLESAPRVAVVAQGVAESAYALPKGVIPIRAAGAPPQPRAPAISPGVGNRATVFKLKLSTPMQRQARRAPVLGWILIGTPGLPRCFARFLPRLRPLVASSSNRRAGAITYVYRLGPAGVRRRTWCPGRYELSVVPGYSPRSQPSQPSPDLLPGSSIYFQVR